VHRQIIDDEGEIFDSLSRRLQLKLYDYRVQEDDGLPLLRNLGFIDLRQHAGGVLVSFRPRTVSQVAFVALNYWLWDNPPSRIILRILEDGICDEMHSSRIAAVRRMQALIDDHQRPASGLFQKEAVSLEQLPAGSALHRALQTWQGLGAARKWHQYWRHLTPRFVLLKPDADAGSLVIQAAGPGLRIPDRSWAYNQVGRRMNDLPDQAYGRWVCDSYRSVLARREPQLEAVDAMIDWPRNGRVRSEYVRLILPVLDDDGAMALLGVSDTTDGLDRDRNAA
jgi:hypothetical protein